jgi:sulfopyruvate decarboxylase alpha subunit
MSSKTNPTPQSSAASSGSRAIVEALREAGITTIATLPELKLFDLIDLVSKDNGIRHVQLCREEEGVAICAGSYIAGGKPALIMQNGGLMNSVNGLVSTAIHLQIPMLLLVYYAGDFGDRGFSTVGNLTEGVLQGLQIRYQILRRHEDIRSTITGAWTLAEDSQRPVAILLTKSVLLQ